MALVGIDARFIYRHRWSGLSYYLYNLLGEMVDLSPHHFRPHYETEPAHPALRFMGRDWRATGRNSRTPAWQ